MNLKTWMAMACTVVVSATASLAGCSSPTEPRSLVVTDSPDETETDPAPEPIANSPDASSPDAASLADADAPDVALAPGVQPTEPDAAPVPPAPAPDAATADEDAGVDAAPDADVDAGPALVICRIYVPADSFGDPAGYIAVEGCNGVPPQNVRQIGGVRAVSFYDPSTSPPSQSECTWPTPPVQGTPITSSMYGNCLEGNPCTVVDGAMNVHDGSCVRQ